MCGKERVRFWTTPARVLYYRLYLVLCWQLELPPAEVSGVKAFALVLCWKLELPPAEVSGVDAFTLVSRVCTARKNASKLVFFFFLKEIGFVGRSDSLKKRVGEISTTC